ncbi:substrate-binding domain-containing protein [Dyadobacter sandarakinus]|uniref:Substrate-binding domain-containing protein n=1 Tax=Dyadobacter sandarakinus TaxID=2747268 RepID=A0ABX7I9L0_9BACT|nr:substrate-binding domain-containing protein [Dyadobacter sandarakinus]QRR01863.1 substrate-binding domain-containing protein [Dyadobacter sandarakinus]
MKKKIVRIKDIAEKAQTSKGTVDRVLHNRGRVAEDVRARILGIIKEMDYEPNFIAQSLKSQKEFHFAALIPDYHMDPYWQAPRSGLEKAEAELRKYGVSVGQYIFNPHDEHSFIAKADEATRENPDGVLIAPIFYKETLPFFERWTAANIPFVLFNTQIEHVNPLSYIGQDSYRSGCVAAKILDFGLQGPTDILVAHINENISNSAHLMTKEEGFRDYFQGGKTKGIRVHSREINYPDGGLIDPHLNEIFDQIPNLEAIYITNSKAYEVAAYLEKKGLDDMKVVGYDLIKPNLDYLTKERINFLINQNPLGQGYWGIHQLARHLVFRKEVEPIKFLPLDIITKENLDYYLEPELSGYLVQAS